MADDLHLEMLRNGIAAWNLWRDEHPETIPDLTLADLRSAKLAGIDLWGANLQGVHAPGVKLSKSHLQGILMQGADLRDADLSEADLQGAHLHRANLQGANLQGAHLQGARLDFAILDEANLEKANLHEASFRETRLGFLNIDSKTADQIPELQRKKFEKSWTITDAAPDRPFYMRSIEFPPEYQDAGVAILSHFGSILRRRYKGSNVGVTITQEGDTVTMIVETPDGVLLKEVKETLRNYGLVVQGDLPPERFAEDREELIQLKNQLGLARHQIEMQREFLEYKNADIATLRSLLAKSIGRVQGSSVNVKTTLQAVGLQQVHFSIGSELALLLEDVRSILEHLPEGGDPYGEFKEAEERLEELSADESREVIKKSAAMDKLRRLLTDLGSEDSEKGKIIKGVQNGARMLQSIARHYNRIAEWCGLPQVPSPLLGEAGKV